MQQLPTAEGVILAAGASSRARAFKPALLIGTGTMIGRCIGGMKEYCGRIIVVGGHEFSKLQSLVRGMPQVECVENPAYHKGMFTSVKTGLAQVRADRCFVLPVDIPLVPPAVYQQLLSCEADIVVPSYHGKKGHPVCLSQTILPRILSRPDESSLRETLEVIGFQTVEVEAEEILFDIDTPEDYERACRREIALSRRS
jgi:molybdenum cofactor cytidylyltransferase